MGMVEVDQSMTNPAIYSPCLILMSSFSLWARKLHTDYLQKMLGRTGPVIVQGLARLTIKLENEASSGTLGLKEYPKSKPMWTILGLGQAGHPH